MSTSQRLWNSISGVVAVISLLALGSVLYVNRWRASGVGAVERGRQIALQYGCFNCHGPGGTQGIPNPGSDAKEVPAWTGGTIMMFAKNRAELREYIEYGVPKREVNDPRAVKERQRRLINMPEYRKWLTLQQIDDLVAYVSAVSRLRAPADAEAAEGRDIARQHGCFNCHGPEGRGSRPNPRSFKGYIPGWDGADYRDVVRNRDELKQWVENGISDRFAKNPAARAFLDRAPVKMPKFKGVISAQDLAKVAAYIDFLQHGSKPDKPGEGM